MADDRKARIVRCQRHGLAYDPASAEGCALCRSESEHGRGLPRFDRVLGGLFAAIVILLVGAVALQLGAPLFRRLSGSRTPAAASSHQPLIGAPGAAPTVAGPIPQGQLPLHTKNAIGRSGMLYVPRLALAGPRPLLVLFHGTGGSGATIVNAFLPLAQEKGVILLAPDSGRSPDGSYNWQVPDAPGETAPDQQHVTSCLDEVFAMPGLRIDTSRVLAAGHSGGGSSAAFQATNDTRFSAFAVLHGGVFPRGLGPNRVPGWFSTGSDDALRPPAVIERAAAAAAPHATELTTRVFPGQHELLQAEMADLFAWWLAP